MSLERLSNKVRMLLRDHAVDNFANEARLISKGEAKNRNIYGKVSSKEAENLKDEGIEITSIPWIKDDS